MSNSSRYIKDENKYRVYYKVKNRYMINFKDNYVIKSRDYNLYDVINDTNIEKSKIKTLLAIVSFLVHIQLFYYEIVVDAHKSQVLCLFVHDLILQK